MDKPTIARMQENSTGVTLKIRTENGVKFLDQPFNNYFYIKEEDFDFTFAILEKYVVDGDEIKDAMGKNYHKLFLKENNKRNLVKKILEEEQIEHFEIDLPAHKRMVVDNPDLPLNQSGLKIGFYDLETCDILPFEKRFDGDKEVIIPNSPIMSVAFKDYLHREDGEVTYMVNPACETLEFQEYAKLRLAWLCDIKNKDLMEQVKSKDAWVTSLMEKGEQKLLGRMYDFITNRYDMISAWNGLGFDDLYLRERGKKYGFRYDTLWITGFDYMLCFKKNNFAPMKSYKLNDVAYFILKGELEKEDSVIKHKEEITKIDWKELTDARKYFDLYCCYPDLLKEYNIQDVQLMDMIEKKINYFNIHFKQCEIQKCLMIDTLWNSRMLDIKLLSDMHKIPIICKSKPNDKETDERAEKIIGGGYTFVFLKGLHHNVICNDFAGHYLNIMRTFNISQETYVRYEYPDLSKCFVQQELDYIKFAIKEKHNHKGSDGKLKAKKYEKALEEERQKWIEEGFEMRKMFEIMRHFINNYDQMMIINSETECYTPADLNLDARGWEIHPHVVFSIKRRGVVPTNLDEVAESRNKVKYDMENHPEDSFEYKELWDYQYALKTIGNSYFGVLNLRSSRWYHYFTGNSITTSARFFTKVCMELLWREGLQITHGDTDSSYYKGISTKEEFDALDQKFKELLDKEVEKFNTLEVNGKKHTIEFEYEKTLDQVVVVAKKRYYYFHKGKVKCVGGYLVRSDVNRLGAELQEELLLDIFTETYTDEKWVNKILDMKNKVYNFELPDQDVIQVKGLSKEISNYGLPMIDKQTGQQKVTKDGNPRFAPIPAQVKVAKKMMEEGELVEVGDKIHYVVLEHKPRIIPLTINEYNADKRYSAPYYHEQIVKPLIEILSVVYPEKIGTMFKDCWHYTKRQLDNYVKKLEDEFDIESQKEEEVTE